jgi:hypothetical protein
MNFPKFQRRMRLWWVGCLVLFILALIPAAARGQAAPPQANPAVATSHSAASAAQGGNPRLAHDTAPWRFLRLVAVLCSGFCISAARLASKFRRFWGLGVFTNAYAVLFLIFGVGLCGIPVTSETALRNLPYLQSFGPWVADLSGIVVALLLPAIRLKPQPRAAADNQVSDLSNASSSNPILAVIEDEIRDRIQIRMQREIVAACRRYDWNTIQLAASRALEEEQTIRPMTDEKYQAVSQSIHAFAANPDQRIDSNNKYAALVGLLRWCSFKRLRSGLEAAACELQP